MEEMNITAAQYIRGAEGTNEIIKTTIDGEELFVPIDEGNRHYKAILAWVAEGNTIEEAD